MTLKTQLIILNTVGLTLVLTFLFIRLKEIKKIIGKTYNAPEVSLWMKEVYIILIILSLTYYWLANRFIIKYL